MSEKVMAIKQNYQLLRKLSTYKTYTNATYIHNNFL